jgi:hypothetical protein
MPDQPNVAPLTDPLLRPPQRLAAVKRKVHTELVVHDQVEFRSLAEAHVSARIGGL